MIVTFYRVYDEDDNECIITPSYNDANAEFFRLSRTYLTEVKLESIEGDNSMQDIADGVYEGKPVIVKHNMPF